MCNHSGKLMAWLDRELGSDEVVELERHIDACSECRSRLESYKQASATFDTYCDAVVSAKTHWRRVPRWVPVLTTTAAVAIAPTPVFVLLRAPVEPSTLPPAIRVQTPPPPAVVVTVPAPSKPVPGHRPTTP